MEIIKSNIKKVYYWVILLVVIVALALVYMYMQARNSQEKIEKEEQTVLNNLSQVNPSTLTDQEKLDILNGLSGKK